MSPPPSGVDWRPVLGAIKAWFELATGLQSAWTKQPGRGQSVKPFGTLCVVSGPFKIGQDSLRQSWNVDTQKIDRKVTGTREFVVTCQAFTDEVDHLGHARVYVDAAQSSLEKPSVVQALRDAGVAIVTIGDVTDLSDIAGANWQSRCSFDVRFRVASEVTDDSIINIESFVTEIDLLGTVSGDPIIIREQ